MPDSPDHTPLDIEFRRPDSQVVSVRLNAEESQLLTEEARLAGEKLSTFMKELAFEAIRARRASRERKISAALPTSGVVFSHGVTTNSGVGSHPDRSRLEWEVVSMQV